MRAAIVLFAAAAFAAMALGPVQAQTSSSKRIAKKATVHRVAIQVNQNDKAVMNLALNNASNVIEHYRKKGEAISVEVVTFGPGLHMLRSDTSPVKDRIAAMSLQHSNIRFAACANTQANMSKAESKPISLVSEAKITPSGVVRIIELQRRGYAYIRP